MKVYLRDTKNHSREDGHCRALIYEVHLTREDNERFTLGRHAWADGDPYTYPADAKTFFSFILDAAPESERIALLQESLQWAMKGGGM